MGIIKILDTAIYLKQFRTHLLTVKVSGSMGGPLNVYADNELVGTIYTNDPYYCTIKHGATIHIEAASAWDTGYTYSVSSNNFKLLDDTVVSITAVYTPPAPTTYDLKIDVTNGGGYNAYYVTIGTEAEQGPFTVDMTFSGIAKGTQVKIRAANAANYTNTLSSSLFTMTANKTVPITWTYEAPTPTTYTLKVTVSGRNNRSGNTYYVTIGPGTEQGPYTSDKSFNVAKGTSVKIRRTNATNYTSTISPSSSFTMTGAKTVTIKWTYNAPVTPDEPDYNEEYYYIYVNIPTEVLNQFDSRAPGGPTVTVDGKSTYYADSEGYYMYSGSLSDLTAFGNKQHTIAISGYTIYDPGEYSGDYWFEEGTYEGTSSKTTVNSYTSGSATVYSITLNADNWQRTGY